MLRTDFDPPLLMGAPTGVRLSLRLLRLCSPGILFLSCAAFGVTQCSAQDVAEAARQERAQKESKQKNSKHVYTEQDLKREQILTPEDRAQIAARKNQTVPPAAEKSPEAVDAQSLPPDAPLGDVARHFRKQKQSQKLERSAEFHLPVADAPVFATPRPPVMPVRPPVSNPAPPQLVPYQAPKKRSPFERPKVFMAAPSRIIPSHPPAARIEPSNPAVSAAITPVAPVVPVAPSVAAKRNSVVVKPGDSLWRIAEQNLGKGFLWHDVLAVNPGIVDANHIAVGSQIYLPAAVSSHRTTTVVTVRKGNTLSTIARSRLGRASYWSCIAQANPAVRDANLIYEGQVLRLPGNCKP
jgi:nucleoid-associated protein YgaU